MGALHEEYRVGGVEEWGWERGGIDVGGVGSGRLEMYFMYCCYKKNFDNFIVVDGMFIIQVIVVASL
jgi:hypothetical protein